MKNIGIFVFIGLLSVVFQTEGWFPNEDIYAISQVAYRYVLPCMIAYEGGNLLSDSFGGLAAVMALCGILLRDPEAGIFGAMVSAPLGGYLWKKEREFLERDCFAETKMLFRNLLLGLTGAVLAVGEYYLLAEAVTVFAVAAGSCIGWILEHGYIAVLNVLIEPAKVFFLNNIMNHGILVPLGMSQAEQTGGSLLFLLETNPGPGLGMLLGLLLYKRKNVKRRQELATAAFTQVIGGIHEVYFPFVLADLGLLLPLIVGGVAGSIWFSIFHCETAGVISPGSVLTILIMAGRSSMLPVLGGIFVSTAVSGVGSYLYLCWRGERKEVPQSEIPESEKQEELEKENTEMSGLERELETASEQEEKPMPENIYQNLHKIGFVCNGGMGSSAMGAGVLRKKVQDAGLTNISVTNSAINSLPPDVDLVITHRDLTERAMRQVPQAQHISLTNFLDSGLYTSLTERLVAAQRHIDNEVKVTDSLKDSFDDTNNNLFQLGADNIFLGRKAATKEEAIRFAGEQLVKGGYVEPEYVQAMLDREKLTSTYLGESIAVPHGTIEAKDRVLKTGVVFCQYPEGVRFGEEEDEVARLVIGIAARNNEHIQVITSLTNALDDETVIERLAKTTSVDEVLALLNK